jgi:hypothetical protein
VAVCCSFINLFLVLFVFPESVTQDQRDLASGKSKGKARDPTSQSGPLDDVAEERAEDEHSAASSGIIRNFLRPLAIFLPVPIFVDGTTRKRKDWSLTLLACGLFGYMLSTVGGFLLVHLLILKCYNRAYTKLSTFTLAMCMVGVPNSLVIMCVSSGAKNVNVLTPLVARYRCWVPPGRFSSYLLSLVRLP